MLFKAWISPIELPRRWRLTLGIVEVVGPVLLAAVPLWWPGQKMPPYMPYAVVAVAAITVLAMLTLRVVSWVGEPAKPYVDCVLRELAQEIWTKSPKSLAPPIFRHRVTLFELQRRWWICKWCQPKWTHRLVPRARWPLSGRRPRRCFRVHEHMTENGEGMCGQIMASGSLVATDLPDLHAAVVTDQDYATYAEKTLDSIKMVKRERYYARVIGGFTIYDKDGRIWGVLAFDSSDPAAIASNALDSAASRRTLGVLAGVLSESHR